MNVWQTVIFFLLASLQEGDACLGDTDTIVYTGTEGGDIKIGCSYDEPTKLKRFCKQECKEGDTLIETTGVKAQHGRYTLEYDDSIPLASMTTVYVSITNLTKADAGIYRCMFIINVVPEIFQVIELRVNDAPISYKPFGPPPLLPSSTQSAPSVTPTPATDAGSTTSRPNLTVLPHSASGPSSSSAMATLLTPAAVRAAAPRISSSLYLKVAVIMTISVSSAAALLIFCRRRASTPKDPHGELESIYIAEQDFQDPE